MSENTPARFTLTLRQRRLRVLTLLVLGLVLGMIAVGVLHPFFRSVASPQVAEAVRQEIQRERLPGAMKQPPSPARKAVFVRLVCIYIYWTACVLLTTLVFVLAWMDVREVRRQMLRARQRIWREIADQQGAKTPPPPEA